MSFLRVYHEADGEQPLLTTQEPERLRLELEANAIHYRHHPLPAMPESAPSDALLARYTPIIAEVGQLSDCRRVELRGMSPRYLADTGGLERESLSRESRSDSDDWHLLLHGQAVFYLHLNGRVYVIGCERGDLLLIPAGVPHWFDIGPSPDFVALSWSDETAHHRLETTSDIALRFPRYEALYAEVA
ncbi:cupin [Salinicola endophyticus]|uniref:Cupin n=1 Tax=Salinicola endophyticus TaxID=1949083 RepID=A0AB74UCJ7_9GAMM